MRALEVSAAAVLCATIVGGSIVWSAHTIREAIAANLSCRDEARALEPRATLDEKSMAPSTPNPDPAVTLARDGFILAPDTFAMQWTKGYASRAEAQCWSLIVGKSKDPPQTVQLVITAASGGAVERVELPAIPAEAAQVEPHEWGDLRSCVADVARTMRFPALGKRVEKLLVQADRTRAR